MICALPVLMALTLAQAPASPELFRDPGAPLERRVDDLVARLTLEEKIGLLGQVQPAIPRLGIAAFTNFTEGLHGLGWVRGGSVTATTFPQSVGLGETWDADLLREVGAVEGYEARVYFRKFDGARVGLAIRAPNVDLARDPRWGRSEESFGEDPYLVGKLSVAMIRGLQGDNPKYLLTAATMKHFLANSNEDGRTSSSSDFDERNLREYYLEPFRRGIEEANAQSFMASYNAVNGIPDTVSPFIRNIVEKEWKFDGMVSTDAGSLPNLTRQFHYYPDATQAVAGAVKAGITVFLDQYTAPLKDALEKKLLTEADIERNIRGNIRMRMRLGEFDPPEMSPYNQISGTEEPWYGDRNKALARKATQESIVLLKNSESLLPLDKSKLRSIAVIGPFGDNVLIDWYAGMPPYSVTPLEGIRSAAGPGVRVRYAPDNNNRECRESGGGIRRRDCVRGQPSDLQCAVWPLRVAERRQGGGGPEDDRTRCRATGTDSLGESGECKDRCGAHFELSLCDRLGAGERFRRFCIWRIRVRKKGTHWRMFCLAITIRRGGLVSTWVASLNDLPLMMDYDIRKGRTHMYFKGQPLYPFGVRTELHEIRIFESAHIGGFRERGGCGHGER